MHSDTNRLPCIETLQLETFCIPNNQSLLVAYTLWCHFVQMSPKTNNGCCLSVVAWAEMSLLVIGPKSIYVMTITRYSTIQLGLHQNVHCTNPKITINF